MSSDGAATWIITVPFGVSTALLQDPHRVVVGPLARRQHGAIRSDHLDHPVLFAETLDVRHPAFADLVGNLIGDCGQLLVEVVGQRSPQVDGEPPPDGGEDDDRRDSGGDRDAGPHRLGDELHVTSNR